MPQEQQQQQKQQLKQKQQQQEEEQEQQQHWLFSEKFLPLFNVEKTRNHQRWRFQDFQIPLRFAKSIFFVKFASDQRKTGKP